MSKYLVTGATGALGSLVVSSLLQRVPASEIVALVHNPKKQEALAEKNVEVREGDYLQANTLDRAFKGIDKMLLISAPAFTDATAQHANVIEAAKRNGVQHLIYAAIQRVEGSRFEIPQVTDWDKKTEFLLEKSGLEYTIIRNSMYLDMLPIGFGKKATEVGVRVPAGSGRAALASRHDLAEGAAAILTGEGHEGKVYTLGNSEASSLSEIAAFISKAVGRTIDYMNVSVADFVSARVKDGFPEPAATFFAAWFQAIGAGEFAEVTGDLERLIGRKPQSAEDFFTAAYSG